MAKRILIGLFSIAFLSALIFGFLYFRQLKSPVTDALYSIPPSAAVILKANNTESLISKIMDGNLMWEELNTIKGFGQLNQSLVFVDSVIKSDPGLTEVLREKPLYLSLHKSGIGKADFLLSLSFPPSASAKMVNKAILDASGGASMAHRDFDQTRVTSLKKDRLTIHFSFLKNVLLLSQSGHLLETAITQLNSEENLLFGPAFAEVRHTANQNSNANLFINYKQFIPLTSGFLGHESQNIFGPLENLAEWAALDVNIKPNALMLNGFSFSHDSLGHYINLFSKQKPQPIEVPRVLPASVASLLCFGFSNFSDYYQNQRELRAKQHPETETELGKFITTFGQEAEFKLFSWVANEMAVLVTSSDSFGLAENSFAVFKASNIENAKNQLGNFGNNDSSLFYQEFEIRQLPIGNAYELLLGKAFANISTPWYTSIGRYIIIGNSPHALYAFIDEYLAERTLQKDRYFASFSENLASDANLFLYSNIRRSIPLYKNFISPENSAHLDENREALSKFEALAFQLNSNGKLFYHNFFLKYNPNVKQENVSLWETQLDSTVSSKPRIVHNHLNNSREIIVQDDAHNLYLVSNTGKILWKRKLEGKILGEIHQVDLFKNNKLQYLFNTAATLYAIDRNGNNVEKFPVAFNNRATAALALMDYDNNRDYRIIVPQEDLKIHNYTSSGEPVKGWNPVLVENPVKAMAQHVDIAGKDFIIALDEIGKVYVFDRKGESRARLREKLPFSSENQVFYLDKGKSLAKTYLVTTDSTGTIYKLNLMDELEKNPLKEFSTTHKMDFKDLNADKNREFVFTDKNKLSVFSPTYQQKFEYVFKNELPFPAQYFLFPDGNGKIGVVDPVAGEIYLFDEVGNLIHDFPLKGSSPFAIGNINQDKNLNLVTGFGRNLFLYQLK